jgi:hypothetical protein
MKSILLAVVLGFSLPAAAKELTYKTYKAQVAAVDSMLRAGPVHEVINKVNMDYPECLTALQERLPKTLVEKPLIGGRILAEGTAGIMDPAICGHRNACALVIIRNHVGLAVKTYIYHERVAGGERVEDLMGVYELDDSSGEYLLITRRDQKNTRRVVNGLMLNSITGM